MKLATIGGSADPIAVPNTADIVIVGGGLAGLETAKELDRLGVAGVLVLEAGPANDVTHINAANDPNVALRLWLEPGLDLHFWRPWTSTSSPHWDGPAGLRRRLGGRSLYWHGVVLPLEPWALTTPFWPEALVDDLTGSWRGGPSLYERVHADLDDWRGSTTAPGDGRELAVGDHRLTSTPQAIRVSAGPDGSRWRAYSPIEHWSRPGQERDHAPHGTRIVPDTEVLGVTVDGGRVTGVVAQQGPHVPPQRVDCDTVVLAASTIENSRLAIQALHSCGALAEPTVDGLTDHIVQGFVAAMDPARLPAGVAELAAADSFLYTPCPAAARSNLFLRLHANQAGAAVVDAWTMGEQLPSGEGVIRCIPRDTWPWDVVVRARLTPDDREVVRAQREELQSFWDAWSDLCHLTRSALVFSEFDSPSRTLENLLPGVDTAAPDGRPVTWSGPLGSEYHEASSLAFGKLLNEQHQVVSVDGLYAAGPCAYPRPGAANPSLTNLALARRLAAVVADRLTAGRPDPGGSHARA